MYKQALQHNQAQDWYRSIHDYIWANYSDPELFAGLLSATSPRKQVRANYNLAIRIYTDYTMGRAIDYTGVMPALRHNVDRVLSGQELSGPKVRAFYANLCGDYDQVTIDVWMLKFYKVDYILTPKRYKKLEKRLQRYARMIGMEPAGLQAVIWTYIRAKEGRQPVDFRSIAEEKQGLLWPGKVG